MKINDFICFTVQHISNIFMEEQNTFDAFHLMLLLWSFVRNSISNFCIIYMIIIVFSNIIIGSLMIDYFFWSIMSFIVLNRSLYYEDDVKIKSGYSFLIKQDNDHHHYTSYHWLPGYSLQIYSVIVIAGHWFELEFSDNRKKIIIIIIIIITDYFASHHSVRR